MVDFRWMSNGGFLLDGNGDLAVTSDSTNESIVDLVRTRLKSAFNGWKLYQIGADLQARPGDLSNPETELRVQRQASASLSDILASGSYEVQTLIVADGTMAVLVYLRGELIAQTTLTTKDLSNASTIS